MPDPKIRQRKFDWAEPEAPTLTSEWQYTYAYKVGSKVKTPKGVFTVTSASASNAMQNTSVLTKASLQAAVKMLKEVSGPPPEMIMHPFAVKDLMEYADLDTSATIALDLESTNKILESWLEGSTWEKESTPSPSSLSV